MTPIHEWTHVCLKLTFSPSNRKENILPILGKDYHKIYQGYYKSEYNILPLPDSVKSHQEANKLCYDNHGNGTLAIPDSRAKELAMLEYAKNVLHSWEMDEITLLLGK